MRTRTRRALTAGVMAAAVTGSLTACGGSHGSARASSSPTASPSASPAAARLRPALRPTWPLTGLPAGSSVGAPALSVKVDNAPAARPQSGLDRADVVFECLVEGGMSRFFAVYHSRSAAAVGPIRSARPVDGALLRALRGGLFGYSGAANGEIAPAKAYSGAFLLSNDADPRPFYRLSSRRPPENVYATTDSLRAEAARLGATRPAPPRVFTYGRPTAGAVAASGVQVVLGSQSSARWVRRGGSYLRWEDGTPHLLADGQQVSAVNVVILRVRVTGSGILDAAGNEDPFVLAYGGGAAEVLRDGVVERGTWSRPTVAAPFAFRGPTGAPLTLAPGPTWVELVPLSGSAQLL